MGIVPLSYRCFGVPSSPTLLLLHGFLGDHHDWQAVISLLQQDFFIIAVDLPAHGQSTWQHSEDAIGLFCQRWRRCALALSNERFVTARYVYWATL